MVIYVPLLGAERNIDVHAIGLLLTVRAVFSMVARLFYARMVLMFGRWPLMIASTLFCGLSYAAFAAPLERIGRLLRQRREDRGRDKIYALHAPEVECIGKGKAHKRFEFGVKVSLATTNRTAPGGTTNTMMPVPPAPRRLPPSAPARWASS